MFGRNSKKYRKIFYLTFIIACLIGLVMFWFLFMRITRSGESEFYSQVRSWHEQAIDREDYCRMFAQDRERLIEKVEVDKKWILVGREVSARDQSARVTLIFSDLSRQYFDQKKPIRVSYELLALDSPPDQSDLGASSGTLVGQYEYFAPEGNKIIFKQELDLSDWSPGSYALLINSRFECGRTGVVHRPIQVSYPLYVAWTFDWEGYDIKQVYLEQIEQLSAKHGNLPLTHFINPRLFLNSAVSTQKKARISHWLKERQESAGDSLGLHLHLSYENLEAAGIKLPEKPYPELLDQYVRYVRKFNTSTPTSTIEVQFDKSKLEKKQIYDLPYWGYAHDDGYDIPVTALGESDLNKLLKWSVNKFMELGLGRPIVYRSGGWFADEKVLRALQDNGFVLDSSGRTKYVFGTAKMPGFWDLPATAAPYRPNLYDQNSDFPPTMDLWEFPNNGGDSWWYGASALKQRFNLNWGEVGRPIDERKAVVLLSHPDWFHVDYPKMDELLAHINQFSYYQDGGPVIYANLEQLYHIWENKENKR